uniref:Uncharacterized protein n=1 Tax=Oryza punctata TaxID=4537 RepID=A0A0E0L0Z5_ORYPU
MSAAKQAPENGSPPTPPHCWICSECTLATRSYGLLLHLMLLKHGSHTEGGNQEGGRPSRRMLTSRLLSLLLLGASSMLIARVFRYVVRCIIRSRYPAGTMFGTCGITTDAQVSNLTPGTCEVSSIMVGCEVSGIMIGCDVSSINHHMPHLLFSLQLGLIVVSYCCRNQCHCLCHHKRWFKTRGARY